MSFEIPKDDETALGLKAFDVDLPPDPLDMDREWCAEFNENYGGGRWCTLILATHLHREIADPHTGRLVSPKGFESLPFDEETQKPIPIVGLITRAMVKEHPINEDLDRPFIGLVFVENEKHKTPIYHHENQEFLFPMEGHEALTLFTPVR